MACENLCKDMFFNLLMGGYLIKKVINKPGFQRVFYGGVFRGDVWIFQGSSKGTSTSQFSLI